MRPRRNLQQLTPRRMGRWGARSVSALITLALPALTPLPPAWSAPTGNCKVSANYPHISTTFAEQGKGIIVDGKVSFSCRAGTSPVYVSATVFLYRDGEAVADKQWDVGPTLANNNMWAATDDCVSGNYQTGGVVSLTIAGNDVWDSGSKVWEAVVTSPSIPINCPD